MRIKQTLLEKIKTRIGLFLIKLSTRVMIYGINITKHKVRLKRYFTTEPCEISKVMGPEKMNLDLESWKKLPHNQKIKKVIEPIKAKHLYINKNHPKHQKFIDALESGLTHAYKQLNKVQDTSDHPIYVPHKNLFPIFSQSESKKIFDNFLNENNSLKNQDINFKFKGGFEADIKIIHNEKLNSKLINMKLLKDGHEIDKSLIPETIAEKIVEKLKQYNNGLL